jgi:hypothetical protein
VLTGVEEDPVHTDGVVPGEFAGRSPGGEHALSSAAEATRIPDAVAATTVRLVAGLTMSSSLSVAKR